jgi:molybdate transport system substrate-binding protein
MRKANETSGLRSDGQAGALSHLLLLVLFCAACAPHHPAQKLTVAAAADLNFALPEMMRQFRAAGAAVELQIAYGSSGNFYAQIGNGAPFDVFLSADVAYPRKLAAGGIGVGNSVFTYAVGRLVVWVPAASPLDPATALREASVKHIAIANPQHAPYGRAAEAALRSLGLYQTVEPKLVLGENIAQTLQFVESGAAEAGIVAMSLAVAPPVRARGRYWEIPPDAYPRIEQGGIILKDSPAARDFRGFLLSAAGRRILKQYGFFVPGE